MEPPSKPPASIPDAKSAPASPSQRLGLGGLLVVAIGSLLAVPGVLFDVLTGGAGFLGPVVAGPLIEEALKPTGLIILLTRHPDLKLSATTGVLAGAFSGLVFAAIENLIYLLVYVPEHDSRFVIWRWTVCVGVHVACSALVGYGLARRSGGQTAMEAGEYRLLNSASSHLLDEPRERSGVFQRTSLTCLVIAVVLHGAYNLAAILLQLGHYTIEK